MSSVSFDQERATSHDMRSSKLAPMREALHLFIRMIFADLPAEARVLCVGAGTGPELIYLANVFPKWRFTVVEPSSAMLNVCREKTEELGIASRCTFHEGFLESLPGSSPFDAATCILVSQFLLESEKRIGLFSQIAKRMSTGGLLVSADLASDMSSPKYKPLFEVWARTMNYSGVPVEHVENLGHNVAVLPQQQIESFIEQGGFEQPVLFFQSLLIHAWFSHTPTEKIS